MKRKDIALFGLAFIMPIIIMSIAYALVGMYPFGNKSILSMDMWGQYYPMIKANWYDMRSFISDKYSWDGGLGFNLYAQTLYYCNSLFYKILAFVPGSKLIEALDVVLLIKYGFYSVSFLGFLKYKYKKTDVMTVAFSIAYALSSYALAFINQPMWTDCIILFPLIMIGLERLINENKPVMYTLVLAFTIYTSFYISFSICIFLLLYFAVLLISSDTPLKESIKNGVVKRFIIYSLLAGGITAFSVFSVYMTIKTRNPDHSTIEELKLYHSLFDIAKSMFMFTKPSYEFFVPNIYSGFFVIPFMGIFLSSRDISLKKKISYGVFFIFLLLSFDFNVLDYVWHGFHFPNQLPGRWTFLISFLVLIMAYEGIQSLGSVNIIQLIGAVICMMLVYVLGMFTSAQGDEIAVSKIVTICFGIGYILMIIFFCILNDFKSVISTAASEAKLGKEVFNKVGSTLCIVTAIVIMAEMGVNTGYCAKIGLRAGELANNYFFDGHMEEIRENILDKDDGLYRTEMNSGWTFDPGLLYDYKGISYYSSTMNGGVYNLMEALGNRVYALNVSSIYNAQNNFTNSIFGVKYILDRDKSIDLSCYDLIDVKNGYYVDENRNCLPFVFGVNDELTDWAKEDIGPLQLQNDYAKRALGTDKEVYTQIQPYIADVENATLETGGDWHERHYTRIDGGRNVVFDYSFVCDRDGAYYLQHYFKAGDVVINAAGKEYTININEPVKYLGKLKKGDTVNVRVAPEGYDYALYNIELFRFNMDDFGQMAETLRQGGLQVEKFTDTTIEGTVNAAKDDQLYYTSIADDGGWSVYCDGKKLKREKIADALVAFRTPAGQHNIKMVYTVRGYRLGIIIALICWCILIYLNYKEKISKLIKDKITKSSDMGKEQNNTASE